ncbi:MAG: FtsX-like permease family protein [Planctomycetota bacterium]
MTAEVETRTQSPSPIAWWLWVIAGLLLILLAAAAVAPALLYFKVITPATLVTAEESAASSSALQADFPPELRVLCRETAAAIDTERLRSHIEFLVSCGSRVAGYPGCEEAADYVRARLEEILGPVTVEEFDVVSPVDLGAMLRTAAGGEIPLHAFWPNDVRPNSLPAAGVEGALAYCGRGWPEDYDGKDVEDGIVILDFDSDSNWQLARELGAKAILVIPRGRLSGWQARAKWSGVPVDAPRYYVPEPYVDDLLARAARAERVRLAGAMEWRQSKAKNLYAFLRPDRPAEASDKPGSSDPIVLQAYYDSMSSVPVLAPGAEESCGIAVLLELARVLSTRRADLTRPVCFLATAAHDLALAGESDWCYRHFFDWPSFKFPHEPVESLPYPDAEKQPIPYSVFIGLDLSSKDPRVAIRGLGSLVGAPSHQVVQYYGGLFEKYARGILDRGRFYVDATQTAHRDPVDFFPLGESALAAEVPAALGRKCFLWMTPGDGRFLQDTPFDVAGEVDYANLVEQARTLAGLTLAALARDEITKNPLAPVSCARTIEGDVVWYDERANVFVPEGIVPGDTVVVTRFHPRSSLLQVRTNRLTFAVQPTDPATGGPVGPKRFRLGLLLSGPWRGFWPRAYAFDDSGNIVFASSEGEQAEKQFKTHSTLAGGTRIVTFPCRALSLFSAIDPQYLTVPQETYVYALTGAAPRDYGMYHPLEDIPSTPVYGNTDEGARVVFVSPDERVRIVLGSSVFGVRFALLGASDDLLDSRIAQGDLDDSDLRLRAEGLGYGYQQPAERFADSVTDGLVWHTSYKAARDLWVLDELRLGLMTRHNIINLRASARHEEIRDLLLSARDALEKRDYGTYLSHVRQALRLALRNYADVRYTMTDTVKGVVFYFALLLPFCFFMERLLFAFSDIRKRIAAVAAIFLAVFLILRLVHPAFGLSRQPYVILLAFVMLIMALIVLFVVIAKFAGEVRKMKTEAHGMYESDVGRLSATGAAVSIGVSNLRRRKTRTTLTAVTLTLLTFLVISLMTVRNKVVFWEIPRSYHPAYDGALFRNRNLAGMERSYYEDLRSAFPAPARVFPRFWRHKLDWIPFNIDLFRDAHSASANAVLGITPEECDLLGLRSTFVGTGGRTFSDSPLEVILPESLARLLGVDPARLDDAFIDVAGRPMRVVAVFDKDRMNAVIDLDGDPILPNSPLIRTSNLETQTVLMSEAHSQRDVQPTERLDASRVILLPAAAVEEMGGILASVSVHNLADPADFRRAVEAFLSGASVNVFLSAGGKASVLSSFGTTLPMAPTGLLVTIAIAALIVLNTMMGAVHERVTEIDIYSSVGLAPSHISALFFAESAVFATIGAVLGYLLGQSLAAAVRVFHLDIGLSLNYSSLSAVLSTLLVMAVVLLSTWWPASVAASRAVPDVSRKWRIPPPQGDVWTFEFPFTVGGRDILGLYRFLANFFESRSDTSIGGFYAEKVRLEELPPSPLPAYRVSLSCWIAPFDLGISQTVELLAADTGEHNIFMVLVTIRRLSGDIDSWRRMNRGFLNLLRKRFLIWRAVPEEMKEHFRAEGRRTVESSTPAERNVVP